MSTEHLVPARDYVAGTGARLFPTIDSLHYFTRRHAAELAGSVLTHRGRRYIDVPRFERAVVGIIAAKG